MINFPRLFVLGALLAAPVCNAQLPPSMIKPGVPVPAPVAPVPPAPLSPLSRLKPAEGAPSAPAPEAIAPSGLINALTAEETENGWKLLFDGKRLIGMRGVQHSDPLSSGWKIQDGELVLPKSLQQMERVTGGDIITADAFWDFDFRFEWKTTASANSGVRYMIAESMGQSPAGLEYQIIDDIHNAIGLKGGPIRRSGALDAVLPVGGNARLRMADPLNKIGDPWNEGRIVVQGTHVEHWLNGVKALEFELGPKVRAAALAYRLKEKPKDLARETISTTFGNKNRTRICILDQGYEVSFRNLKILALPPQAVVLPPVGPR